jgi:signal transduction histidine kinase
MGPIENPHYRSYISDIHFSSTHLLNLINEILNVTKSEAGKLEVQEQVFDLRDVIEAVVRISGPPISKAGVTVRIDLAGDLPRLRADEGKTRQVFFSRFDRDRGLSVTVADTGIGIAPEDLDRVLEPFVQVDSSLSRRHQGTGLGLPAVKGIMQLHGGTIALQSTLGHGTKATITFPPERAILEPALGPPQPAD